MHTVYRSFVPNRIRNFEDVNVLEIQKHMLLEWVPYLALDLSHARHCSNRIIVYKYCNRNKMWTKWKFVRKWQNYGIFFEKVQNSQQKTNVRLEGLECNKKKLSQLMLTSRWLLFTIFGGSYSYAKWYSDKNWLFSSIRHMKRMKYLFLK